MSDHPAGYTYDDTELPRSSVTSERLAELHASVLWTDDDAAALRRAAEVLVPRTEEILDVWYGFVGSTPHLVATFAGPDGQPDAHYLAGVRARFGQWIADVCTRTHDAQWLAYQEEIARRHTVSKGRTDDVRTTSPHVPLADLVALIAPITLTIRPFIGADGADAQELQARYDAWFKAVTLTVALWSHPYSPELW